MRRILIGSIAVLVIIAAAGLRVAAQDAAVASAPTDMIDRIMGLIGQGQVDDAVGMMEGVNTQPELKEAARGILIHLRDEQGQYHGLRHRGNATIHGAVSDYLMSWATTKNSRCCFDLHSIVRNRVMPVNGSFCASACTLP